MPLLRILQSNYLHNDRKRKILSDPILFLCNSLKKKLSLKKNIVGG